MKTDEGNLNSHCWVKEANLKGVHTVWFQLPDILQKAKLLSQLKEQWLPWLWEEKDEWTTKKF